MTKRRPIIAGAFVLATLGAGIAATGVAQADRVPAGRITTTTKSPNTIPICNSGTNCQRTKNAALPATTTTKPKTVTTPMPTIKPRTKNAALPTTTAPRGRTVTTPLPPVNTIKR